MRGISGLDLKLIAIITMLIDHIAAIIIKGTYSVQDSDGVFVFYNDFAYQAYRIMRIVGRMAFPIFCFLLVQGFYHTRNKVKYCLTLFAFAILSEIPFDMAFEGKLFTMESNNVMWTLLLGILTIWILDEIYNNPRFLNKSKNEIKWLIATLLRCTAMMTLVMLSMLCAEYWLKCDYGASGIAAICIMYLLYKYPLFGFFAGVIMLGLLCGEEEYVALLMLIPLYFYNGQRGKQIKYLFYFFYPAHLLILTMINNMIC